VVKENFTEFIFCVVTLNILLYLIVKKTI